MSTTMKCKDCGKVKDSKFFVSDNGTVLTTLRYCSACRHKKQVLAVEKERIRASKARSSKREERLSSGTAKRCKRCKRVHDIEKITDSGNCKTCFNYIKKVHADIKAREDKAKTLAILRERNLNESVDAKKDRAISEKDMIAKFLKDKR